MITDTERLVMTNAASLQTDQSQEAHSWPRGWAGNQATHHSAICMVIAILQWLNSQYYHCLIQRETYYPDRQRTVVTAGALHIVLECLCLCLVVFIKQIFHSFSLKHKFNSEKKMINVINTVILRRWILYKYCNILLCLIEHENKLLSLWNWEWSVGSWPVSCFHYIGEVFMWTSIHKLPSNHRHFVWDKQHSKNIWQEHLEKYLVVLNV